MWCLWLDVTRIVQTSGGELDHSLMERQLVTFFIYFFLFDSYTESSFSAMQIF